MGDNRDRSADSRFSLGRPRTASAGRCRGRISAAAPSSSPSRSTARPRSSTRSSWFQALRGGRAGHVAAADEGLSDGRAADHRTARRAARPGRVPRSAGPPRDARRPRSGSAWRSLIVGVIVLAQPLLLIIGGLVFAVILDGGTRLLGRVLPIGRGWRLLLVTARRLRLHRLGLLFRRHDHRRPGRSAARRWSPRSSIG